MSEIQLYQQICEADTYLITLPDMICNYKIPKARLLINIDDSPQDPAKWEWEAGCVVLLDPPKDRFVLNVSCLRPSEVIKSEAELREEIPALQKAWDNYQTILKLCR